MIALKARDESKGMNTMKMNINTAKWWERPLRISAVQCNYGEDSFEILKNTVVKGAFNTEQLLHLTAEGHMSFYEEQLHGEKLDRYLAEAHKYNIKEIIYINVHCLLKKYRDEHPDWIQLDREGNEIKAYDVHYFNCINSNWFDYFLNNLKKLCTHDIDGIFLDGPVIASNGCYCKACQDKFFKLCGKSIFEASQDEMMLFKIDSVTEYVKKTSQTAKSVKPGVLIYLNNSALRADVTGNNTRKVEPYVDLLGAEGGFIWVDRNISLWHAGSMAKFIENQAKGKPTVIFFAGDHKPHSYFMHTAAETKIIYAQSIANGASVWYGIHGPTWMMNSPGGKAAIDMNKFHAANEEYYFKTKPLSKVALMWSMDSANYYASSVATSDFTQAQQVGTITRKKGNHYKAFMGFYEMLSRSHIQFDVIDEFNVKEGSINKYDLVILPTCGCMCDQTIKGIKDYVKNGGNIISTYDTGFYDQKGKFVGPERLGDVFGIESADEIVEYKIAGTAYQRVKEDHWCSKGLDSTLIPSPTLAIKTIPSSKAEIVSTYLEPMEGRYVALPDKSYAGMIINSYGKGTSIYIAGTIGEYYNEKTHPVLRQLVNNIVRRLSSPVLDSDTLGSVEFVLRYQNIEDVNCTSKKRYILHVINMTGDMGRPIEKIAPLYDVNVILHLDINVAQVRSITDTARYSELKFSQVGNEVKITIPKVDVYEVIVIE